MSRYDTLVKNHGTLQEFENAVWNALGEISVDEARNAIESYRRDLREARLADIQDQP